MVDDFEGDDFDQYTAELPTNVLQLVLIEVFGGILPVSTALEAETARPKATYYVEVCPDAIACNINNHPEAVWLGSTSQVTTTILHT